jgi:Fe-S-cluster-containing dehydrogenase component
MSSMSRLLENKPGWAMQKNPQKHSEHVADQSVDGTGFSEDINRRRFLSLMSASLALAGLTSCRRPVERIMPYVHAPEEIIPGLALQYATAMPFGLDSHGVLATSYQGRPTKVDGNPGHPSMPSGSNVLLQASLLDLYDPNRSRLVKRKNSDSSWQAFLEFWREQKKHFDANQGEGLVLISDRFSAPTRYRQLQKWLAQYPKSVLFFHEPLSLANSMQGIQEATGQKGFKPVYHLDKAGVIVALDADLFGTEPNALYHACGFSNGRTPEKPDSCNRLYVLESSYTITGQLADHRIRMACSDIAPFVSALLQALSKLGLNCKVTTTEFLPPSVTHEQLDAVARDLYKQRGKCLLVAGQKQPAHVHATVAYLNQLLNNTGQTVHYVAAEDVQPWDDTLRQQALAAIARGPLDTVIFLNSNPEYDHALDLDTNLLFKASHTVHFGACDDETATRCEWHLPASHYLEQWSDVRDWNGLTSIVQPLIQPLYDSRSDIELMNMLSTGLDSAGYDLIRTTWAELLGDKDFENSWRHVLLKGFYPTGQSVQTAVKADAFMPPLGNRPSTLESWEVTFQPSLLLHDGRYAGNGWLQELPDPITKLAWDNVALVSKKAAQKLRLKNGDVVRLRRASISIEIPVWIMAGQADYTITLTAGYGRSKAGDIGSAVGVNVYPLRQTCSEYIVHDVTIEKTGKGYELARMQETDSMHDRPLVRQMTLAEYNQHPEKIKEMVEQPPLQSLWKEHVYEEGYQWGLVIDLNKCNGCMACVVACQSENNIPIVGKEQVANGREMHWIRMDRYIAGDDDHAEMVHQPVACQHCEMAPCEQVCPVAATVHDHEGLNVMAYNRCVGTRYCSNNCPYKARRFNFFNYTGHMPETVKMAQNPEVTVRSRGVMEKCTFCSQRLVSIKQKAKKQGRTVQDGEVKTACQQACPMDAITFGNINDPNALVTVLKKSPRNYELLGELNIRPRTSYLARIKNKNPDWV